MNRLMILLLLSLAGATVQAEPQPAPEQVLLQKMYQLRVQLERERAGRDNEARANTRLAGVGGTAGTDTPTVSGLRAQTSQQLARFEQQFRCLDLDVDASGGNTVVICGDNSGDISGSNVSAERDIITLPGGPR